MTCLLAALLLPSGARAQTPAGTPIPNTGYATYDIGATTGIVRPSNTLIITTALLGTSSSFEFMRYAPGAPGSTPYAVSPTQCFTGGSFSPLAPPTAYGGGVINLANVELELTSSYHPGEPVFVRLVDADQNLNPALAESVRVALATPSVADVEQLELFETGVNTGIFVGYVPTSAPPAPANDCVLAAPSGQTIAGSYTDASNAADTDSDTALIDPESRVFDSSNGSPVDGATVTLIDDATGLPATGILGDDGLSAFSATLISGGSVTDGGGQVYDFGPGGYRYPVVPAGSYRLQVTPPAAYTFPSGVADTTLQTLPGAPFALAVGSRGELFVVPVGPTFQLDLPLDTASGFGFISIDASRDVVSLGEHFQFDVRVENPGVLGAPLGVDVTVVLPLGIRFLPGTVRIDGAKQPDPVLSPDGRTLTWTLPASALPVVTHIRFTVKVTPTAEAGLTRTTARAQALGGTSTEDAVATVRVEEDLGANNAYVIGRVAEGSCDTDDFAGKGVAGVRVYLEDGTFSVTDSNGYYHFAGITAGAHVVQMDVQSLPGFYEPLPCAQDEGHLFAGRPFSQFVEIQGGTLWRSDFRVQLRARPQGGISQRLESQRVDDTIHYQLALRGNGVGVRNARALVMLPAGVEYVPGSTRNAGVPMADPEIKHGVLTYSLGEHTEPDWTMDLTLDALPTGAQERDLETSAVVMFETPVEKLAKTPVAKTFLHGESSSGSGIQVVETLGLRPGEDWQTVTTPAPDITPAKPTVFNKAWLEQAKPGFAWLSPEPGFAAAIASVNIAIQHAPGTRLELILNGAPVAKFNFEGEFSNTAKTVSLSRWRGVDLVDGDNAFVVRALDAQGNEIERIERGLHYAGPPFRAELMPELSKLVADGATPPLIAVRFTDEDGEPARRGQVGAYQVEPPYRPNLDPAQRELKRQAGLLPESPSYVIGEDGIARIELAPTTTSGRVNLRFALAGGHEKKLHPWLEANAREWVLVGLTGGTLLHSSVSEHSESLVPGDVEDGYDLDRGTTVFAKGRVKGSWLLTAAYDSRRESYESSNDIDRAALEGGLDPNQYYTLYGDATTQGFEAPSQSKLYVKLERKQFYALFGDFQTGLTMTELSRYNRSLNGFHTEYDGDYLSLNAFGTDTSQAFVQDEIRGDGTSGLYRLSRQEIVLNSETVAIEIRDRFHGDQVVSRENQVRWVDYNIDYSSGTIFFKRPIPSAGLGFNPVYIVVEYESDDDSDEEINGGGRAALKLFDSSVELGTSLIHEGTVGQTSSLYGSDLRIDLDDSTSLRGEYAMTRSALVDSAVDPHGGAWLAELTRRDRDLDSRLYWREQRPGFGLGQQSASETNMHQLGLDARYRLSDSLALSGEAFRQVDMASDARRDLFEGRLDHHEGPVTAYGGLRWAHDVFSDGEDTSSPQVLSGGSYTTYQNRLKLRADTEVTLSGDESLDFPTRFLVGADFELLPQLTVFGEEELTLASERSTAATRVGLRTSPWAGGQATAAIGQRSQQDSQRLFGTLGMLQTYQMTDALSFDFAVDNSVTLSGDDTASTSISPFAPSQPVNFGLAGDAQGDDFTSISVGTTYAQDLWAANLRVETRIGNVQDKWSVTAGAYRELDEGIGVAVRAEFFDASGSSAALTTGPDASSGPVYSSDGTLRPNTAYDGIESLGKLRVSAVYRPIGGRYTLLESLELRSERLDDAVFQARATRIVNNMNLNIKLDRKTQASLQYGAKYLMEDIDGENLNGYTDVTGLELRRDLFGNWDIGGRVGIRHSWSDGNIQQLYGASVGYILMKNLWVSAGYNWEGYRDTDFSEGEWTSRGPYISFRYKFDQETVKELLDWAE
ncbi:MAG: carboxypeptidase-like regulatory domain-containing protein [Myxococcota bacterium]